ncbi:cinnamyl alcohol dehydrogenase 8-like [Selaginella moellendorffii]|uniref:cinnamyl alcohol dehydrogenase 8-like n=1 Tax=Selaginella moellendorffii TaxID=88036 RepID=UPI000D1C215C|nr:cinnamyl alcohol dehydrogenase 8-like [Selaginella moellendorffii]|eukprot:XP_024519551.1 cinnamyl alcohol dehydrogenase 8-like [Selaginella moellendorffii]
MAVAARLPSGFLWDRRAFLAGDRSRVSSVQRVDLRVQCFHSRHHPSVKRDSNTGKESECLGWAAKDSSGVLAPWKFPRRPLRSTDVKFKISYCGICHTDLHLIHNEWGSSKYPMVPG